MSNQKCIFIAFTLNSSSLADFFIGLVKKLSERYYIIIVTNKKPKINLEFNDNVEILVLPSNRPTNFIDAKCLYKNMKKYKPVMVVSMFGSVNLMTLISWLLKVPIRIAWIRTLSTQYENNRWLMKRKKIIYKLNSHILVNSQATNLDSQKVYSIPKEKITVLPNSIKQSGINTEKKSTAKKYIAYAGRLHHTKGVDTLIEAFSLCNHHHFNIFLDIIGDGPERENLEKLTKQLNLENKVAFHSVQPKQKVMAFFNNAYMVVVPSVYEAFGFVTIEGMSVKTPVIGSNTSGISEIIRHDIDGLLFKPQDEQDLFEKMNLLLTNKEYAKKLGENGYLRFINTYEHNTCIERDAEVLTNWIENK